MRWGGQSAPLNAVSPTIFGSLKTSKPDHKPKKGSKNPYHPVAPRFHDGGLGGISDFQRVSYIKPVRKIVSFKKKMGKLNSRIFFISS